MSVSRVKILEVFSLQNVMKKRKDLELRLLSFEMVEAMESCC